MLCLGCGKELGQRAGYCPSCQIERNKIEQALQFQRKLEAQTPVPAGFWLRLLAYIVDNLIVSIVTTLLLLVAFSQRIFEAIATAISSLTDSQMTFVALFFGQLIGAIVGIILVGWIYFIAFEASVLQGTPGKLLLLLRVTKQNGEMASVINVILRNFYRYAWILPLVLMFVVASIAGGSKGVQPFSTSIAVLMPLFSFGIAFWTYGRIFLSYDRQGFHDHLSGCAVVRPSSYPWNKVIAVLVLAVILFIGSALLKRAVGGKKYSMGTGSSRSFDIGKFDKLPDRQGAVFQRPEVGTSSEGTKVTVPGGGVYSFSVKGSSPAKVRFRVANSSDSKACEKYCGKLIQVGTSNYVSSLFGGSLDAVPVNGEARMELHNLARVPITFEITR